MDQEDKRLIERIKLGKPHEVNAAMGELMNKSKGIIHQIVLAGGGSEEDFLDVLDDAAMAICTLIQKDSFDAERANWRTLIYTIAKNKWFDKKKTTSNYESKFPRFSFGFTPHRFPFHSPVEQDIFSKEDVEKVMYALEQLDSLCRDLMINLYLKDEKLRAISESTEISENTLKQRHKRCKEKLKAIFGKDPRIE